jgi:hypothetical protein
LATIPTLFFNESVKWPPKRCVFKQHAWTTDSASATGRAIAKPRDQWFAS